MRVECLKCNSIEPDDWNHEIDGLYLCDCEKGFKLVEKSGVHERLEKFLKLSLKDIRKEARNVAN